MQSSFLSKADCRLTLCRQHDVCLITYCKGHTDICRLLLQFHYFFQRILIFPMQHKNSLYIGRCGKLLEFVNFWIFGQSSTFLCIFKIFPIVWFTGIHLLSFCQRTQYICLPKICSKAFNQLESLLACLVIVIDNFITINFH